MRLKVRWLMPLEYEAALSLSGSNSYVRGPKFNNARLSEVPNLTLPDLACLTGSQIGWMYWIEASPAPAQAQVNLAVSANARHTSQTASGLRISSG